MTTDRPATTYIGGFATSIVTRQQLADLMVRDCERARLDSQSCAPQLVFSSNGQGIALAGSSPTFAQVMTEADVVHADGMPVVLASRLTRMPLPERIATTDFFHDAAEAAQASGLRFFMLGASQAQNDAAVAAIRARYPRLKLVGQHHGYFDSSEDERICSLVRESHADVLWLALGKPKQEEWAVRNRDNLRGVGWIKTCGGLYAFLAGDVGRAPRWMQRAGLEWLYRGLEDPRRLLIRYLVTNPRAFYRLVRYTGNRRGAWR